MRPEPEKLEKLSQFFQFIFPAHLPVGATSRLKAFDGKVDSPLGSRR